MQTYLSHIINGVKMYIYKSWLTRTDHMTCSITPNHCAVHKAGCWVWSTGNSRQSTVDNTWQRL